MEPTEGARTFAATGDAYDSFMGRYSVPLAGPFADAAGVVPGQRVLDVGCGPGALTAVLVERVGADQVSAVDPSPSFVAACAARHPGVTVHAGAGEALPFPDRRFDAVLAQLVLQFTSEPARVAAEFRRVLSPGGTAAACVWDFAEGMEMLRLFWDAALALDPQAPDEARTLRFGGPGEIGTLFTDAGLVDVVEITLRVTSHYAGFDELWAGFLAGIGPAGSWCLSLEPAQRSRLREELRHRLDRPDGPFILEALARCAVAHAPDNV